MTAPQAQTTLDGLYAGWIPAFMSSFRAIACTALERDVVRTAKGPI
jgi:hypothetical protein